MPLRKQSGQSGKKSAPARGRKSVPPKKAPKAKKAAKKKPLPAPIKKTSKAPKKKAESKMMRKDSGVRKGKLMSEIAHRTEFIQPVTPIKLTNLIKRPETISDDQWNLPIGIKANGEYTFLKDIRVTQTPRVSLAGLSGEDKKSLILKRIQDNPNYPTRQMLGFGEVDKARAIEEVEAETPAGKFIAESEQRVIQKMIDKLKDQENG